MSISTLLNAESEHWTRVASSNRMDNLSDFECSCGLRFVAEPLSRLPRDTPSMVAVHKAEMTLLALGLPTGVVVKNLQEVARPPAGTIIKDAHGVLLQWGPGYGSHGYYRTPSAKRLDASGVASPVTVLWSPPGP